MGLVLPLLNKRPYWERVLAMSPGNLVGYWPLWDYSGTVAHQFGPLGQGLSGAYSGALLGLPGIGDDFPSPSFDGVNDFVNIYSAALAAAFNGAEGTVAAWAKVSGAGVWTDATTRRIIYLAADANNRVLFGRSATNNQLTYTYAAGGTAETVALSSFSPTTWFHIAVTWSSAGDAVKAYINGAQTGTTQSTLGTFAGSLASTDCTIGSQTTAGTFPWSGFIAHLAVWNTPLPATQIASLARL